MIEIKNLTKLYGSNLAVKNISFNVRDNEILGFLGPNGAGKSTTMNMVTGYLPSTSGKVIINGIDIEENPSEAKKLIGYLPEIPPVYPDMRVYEYLSFVAGIKGVRGGKRKEQIETAMERLGIKDMKKRLIRNLSKGYRQRVGFAQALLGNPKFLILDEPTVGLDPNQVMEVRKLIKDLKKDHAVILSSHILQEIQAVCDRVVIISHGEIRADDSIENLENSVSSDITLIIKVKGNKDKVLITMGAIPGVSIPSDITYVETNVHTYTISIAGEEARKEIISRLVAAGCEIIEVSTVKSSLEDVFVKLTTKSSEKKGLRALLDEDESESGFNVDNDAVSEEEEK